MKPTLVEAMAAALCEKSATLHLCDTVSVFKLLVLLYFVNSSRANRFSAEDIIRHSSEPGLRCCIFLLLLLCVELLQAQANSSSEDGNNNCK
mmetsp:Transcript_37509/g.67874  ORF Transcript_37509/g.67874 Transcript_37509/m.67874 type:complete len:92 (-) Transcript_37509:1243-1518(-)